MSNPLISIVMCCHNRRHLLEPTMEAIFAQKYRPVEIVVLDDGSTDGTDELMAGYGDRVRYFRQEARGSAAARNAACREARGDLIAFQDDDDLMLPDRIVKLFDALQRYPAAIFATGDYEIIDTEGNRTGHRWRPLSGDALGEPRLIEDAYAEVMWPNIPAVPQTTLFRKSAAERIGWLDTDFRYSASDKDFYARLARLGPIVYVPEVMCYIRRGHASIWDNKFRALYGKIQLLEKHLSLIGHGEKRIRDRLQTQMLHTLRQVASYKNEGARLDDPQVEEFFQRGLSLLKPLDRISFHLYKTIKLPIRKALQRAIAIH